MLISKEIFDVVVEMSFCMNWSSHHGLTILPECSINSRFKELIELLMVPSYTTFSSEMSCFA